MAGGTKTPTTLNGHNINDGTIYVAKFRRESAVGEVFESVAVTADVVRDFPQYVGGQPQGRVLLLWLEVKRKGTANHFADLKTLKEWCSSGLDEVTLVATDAATSPNTLRLTVKSLGLVPVEGTDWLYEARLWVSRPVWEENTEDDATQAIVASPTTLTAGNVNNGGSYPVKPRVTISPQSYKGHADSPLKRREVLLFNPSPLPTIDANGNPWPVDIVEATIDNEALTDAFKLHPQGYDLYAYVNGMKSNRYLSNFGAGYGDMTVASLSSTIDASTDRIAAIFVLPGCTNYETNNVEQVYLSLKKTGAPVCNLTMDIESNTVVAGIDTPSGSVVGTLGTVAAATLTTSYVATNFVSGGIVLNAETKYWLVLRATSITTLNGSNSVQWNRSGSSLTDPRYEGLAYGVGTSADSGATWTIVSFSNGAHKFRVVVTGNFKCWVPLILPGSIKRTLSQGLTAGAVFLKVGEAEGHSGLPERACYALLNSDAGTVEYIICDGKAGTDQLTIVKRGARGSTAAAHQNGASLYLVNHRIELVYDHFDWDFLIKPVYSPDHMRPIIDGALSTNDQVTWGRFYVPGSESRPGSWRAEFDDAVDLAEVTSLEYQAAANLIDVEFKDAEAAGVYAKRNAVVQNIPFGIAASASAITLDATPISASLSLQVLLTNSEGDENVAATYRTTDAGAAKTITPADISYRMRVRASHDIITGSETSDASNISVISGATYLVGETFVLDEPTVITAVGVRLKCAAGRTFTATLELLGVDDDGSPVIDDVLGATSSVTQANLTTTYTTIARSLTTVARLAAGTYYVGMRVTAIGGAGAFDWSGATAAFARGDAYLGNTATLPLLLVGGARVDLWFRLYGTPIQSDAPSGDSGLSNVDNVTFVYDATRRLNVSAIGAEEDCYVADITLANTTTGQTVEVEGLVGSIGGADSLDIDFDARTVINSDDDLAETSQPFVLAEYDEDDPFRLDPGANTVTYTEAGVVDTDVRLRKRDPYL